MHRSRVVAVTAEPQAIHVAARVDTSSLQVGQPETESGSGVGRARLVSARLPDHAATRRALLDLALGALAALHEAELAPKQLPALDGDAPGLGFRDQGLGPAGGAHSPASHALGAMRPHGEGLEASCDGASGTAGGSQCGRGFNHDAEPTETLALRPRSVAAALAAPELRCRAAWFRELLRSEDGAGPHAAALRSLVDALEVRTSFRLTASSSLCPGEGRLVLLPVCECWHMWFCALEAKVRGCDTFRASRLRATYLHRVWVLERVLHGCGLEGPTTNAEPLALEQAAEGPSSRGRSSAVRQGCAEGQTLETRACSGFSSGSSDDDAPDEFLDPILMTPMSDPVVAAQC